MRLCARASLIILCGSHSSKPRAGAFEVPASWQDRRVLVTFKGVSSAFYLWVNGTKVGYSEDSRTPAEFDLTDVVRPGRNLLAAEVYRYSDGAYLECQDFWRLSGIFRDVVLWSPTAVHIGDVRVVTDLDSAHLDAELRVSITVRNASNRHAKSLVRATLLDPDGATAVSRLEGTTALDPGSTGTVELRQAVSGPRLWSAEQPDLYTLLLTLFDEQGLALWLSMQDVRQVQREGSSSSFAPAIRAPCVAGARL